MEEIWKDVKGYEGIYQISNLGRVKSLSRKIQYHNQYTDKEMILKPKTDKDGYYTVNLVNGEANRKLKTIHRLVAQAFIPNPRNKETVNHKDGNKKNNCVDNLEWMTVKENTQHAIKTGLRKESYLRKPVLQLTLDGKLVKEWESLAAARKKYNTHKIGEAVRGQRPNELFGYIWKYKEQ